MRRLAVTLGALVMLLSGCILYPGQKFNPEQTVDNLGGARFSQEQAVPGFDTSSYTLSEDTLEQFRDLLKAHDIDPGDYRAPEETFCPGGITTRVQMWFRDNGDREMRLGSCAEDGSFEAEATAFFSAVGGGASRSDAPIRVYFTPSDDNHGYLQEDPDQIDRLVQLLNQYGIVPGDPDPSQPAPCEGGVRTLVDLMYLDDILHLRIDSCVGDEWSTVGTQFFQDWKAVSLDGGEWEVVEED